MPIRLLVAITVGIATFSLLVPLPDDVADAKTTEVTVDPDPAELQPGTNVTVAVVTAAGEPVEDATVVVRSRSLPVENDPLTFQTGPDSHTVTLRVTHGVSGDVPVDFRQTQRRGTINFDVVAPTDDYVDDRGNPEVTVIRRW
jgi:hypothetical protein